MNRDTMAGIAPDHSSPYEGNRQVPSAGSHARQVSAGGISISPQQSPRPSDNLQRHASIVSADSQHGWQPIMGQFGPPSDSQSPPLVHQQIWSDSGDLGHGLYNGHQPMAPPEANYFYQNQHQPYTQPHPQPELPHQPPTRSFSSRRRAPDSFQLDNAAFEHQQTPPVSSARSFFSPRGGRFFGHGRSDSGHNLLTASTTPNTPWRATSPAPPPYSPAPPVKKKWWQWRASYVMYIFFFLGLLCAVGHHILYATLDGKVADRQVEMLRYGAAMAFLAKAGFITSVIVAYRQVVWTVVRKRLMSLGAIDSLFAATEDLSALWNVEMYKKATAATLMALLVWLTPLVIIFTGSTLGTAQFHNEFNTTCPGVRTLNFSKESIESWRTPTIIDNMMAQSVSLWNKTAMEDQPQWEIDGFDYWTDSSKTIERTATMAAYSKNALGRMDAAVEICSSGWNCSYVFNFTGPGYDCQDQVSGTGSTLGNFGKHKPPRGFDTGLLLPEGNHSYYVFATGGEYARMQWPNTWPGGIPLSNNPPYPEDLGSFRTEPIIWVGYVERTPELLDQLPESRDDPNWDKAFVPKIFACEHKETEYAVRFNHSDGGRQTYEILSRNFLNPVIDTAWVQPGTEGDEQEESGDTSKIRRRAQDKEGGKNSKSGSGNNKKTGEKNQKTTAEDGDGNGNNDNDSDSDSDSDFDQRSGTADRTYAIPTSNYVNARPPNVERYKLVAAYHSLGRLLRGFVNGTVDSTNPKVPIANTEAIGTKILDPKREWFPYVDLSDRVQSIYEDMLLSMFQRPEFVAVVWAANPWNVSGAVEIPPPDDDDSSHSRKRKRGFGWLRGRQAEEDDEGETAGEAQSLRDITAYPCVRSRNEVRYDYHRRDLWIVYTIAVVLTLACLVVGTLAVLEGENQGALRDTRFSTILAATRGPSLEKLGLLGGGEEELPPDIRKMKLGYGVVHRGGNGSRPGSTFEGVGMGGGLGVLHEEGGEGGGGYDHLNQMDTQYHPSTNPNPISSPPQQQHDFQGGGGGRIWDANSGQYVGFGLEGDVLQRKKSAFRRSVFPAE